nr:hypothetical protein [uncultured Arsenicibacter sp.]
MIKTSETETHAFYLSDFEGTPVRIAVDKETGEVLFDAESIAEIFDYTDAEDMLTDDKVMQCLTSEAQKGAKPIKKIPFN